MRYLSIKNHKAHQHYKNRRPPWIKLHVAILDDYSFACLQDASKAHLLLLGVLASKMDNRIPYDLTYLSQKLGATGPIDVEELILQGFVEVSVDDSKPLALRKQSSIAERETETEREAEKERGAVAPKRRAVLPAWVATGSALWVPLVGGMTPARFYKALNPIVTIHGWDVVWSDLLRWVETRKTQGKPTKLEWYADEASARITRVTPPIVDEWGVPTEYGERLTRPAGVNGR